MFSIASRRGESSRSQTTAHSGLGLSLARRLMTLLGGRIAIRSVAGGEFVVRLELGSFNPDPEVSG